MLFKGDALGEDANGSGRGMESIVGVVVDAFHEISALSKYIVT